MFQVLGLPGQAAQTLHESAVAARQAGHLTHAMAAAHQLTSMRTLSAITPGMAAATLLEPAPYLYSIYFAFAKAGFPWHRHCMLCCCGSPPV